MDLYINIKFLIFVRDLNILDEFYYLQIIFLICANTSVSLLTFLIFIYLSSNCYFNKIIFHYSINLILDKQYFR